MPKPGSTDPHDAESSTDHRWIQAERGARVIDFAGSFPSPERMAFEIRGLFGEQGYSALFGTRWAQVLGVPEDTVRAVAELGDDGFRERAVDLLAPFAPEPTAMVAGWRGAGVRHTVVHAPLPIPGGLTNDDLAQAIGGLAPAVIGFVRIRPDDLEASLAETERLVREHGFRGVTITPFWHRIQADDPILDPVYDLCRSLDIAAYVHTSINWVRTIPLRYEHPLYVDAVACRFPGLRLVAGHGGWPWINEMVAVAMRQPDVYVDFSAFRPKHLATPGAGWEALWYHLPRTLKHKVVLGTTWSLLGRPLATVLDEARALALDDETLDALLYANAARVLGLDHEGGPT